MHSVSRTIAAAFLFISGTACATELETFIFTGTTDDSLPVTINLTVDLDAVGAPIDGTTPPTTETHYDITEPGTGLSVLFQGQTFFAHSLGVTIITDDQAGCGVGPPCDFFVAMSDITRFKLIDDNVGSGGLQAATLRAFAGSNLNNYGEYLDPVVLLLPGYPGNNFAYFSDIKAVALDEPSTLPLIGACGGAFLLVSAIRRKRTAA